MRRRVRQSDQSPERQGGVRLAPSLTLRALIILTVPLMALLAFADDKPPPAKDAAPVGAVQDIVYFAETRPILIRLHVELEGQPFDAAWDDYIDALFKYLDRDGDGVLNSTEAERAPSAQQLAQILRGNLFNLGNLAVADMNAAAVAKPDFGADDDGKVTLEALTRYYRKNG